jgi:hypothetical protein
MMAQRIMGLGLLQQFNLAREMVMPLAVLQLADFPLQVTLFSAIGFKLKGRYRQKE